MLSELPAKAANIWTFVIRGSQSNIDTFMLPGPTLGFIDVYISCKCLFVFSHLHVSNYTMSSTFELKSSSVQHSTRPPKLIICIVQKNLLKHIMANSADYTQMNNESETDQLFS